MPDLSRRYIKTSLAYLVAALLLGVLLSPPVLGASPVAATLYPSYVHLFVVGWLTQLIFGVAYWLFPRYSRERPYGSRRLPEAGYFLLNAGLVLRVLFEPAAALAEASEGLWAGSAVLWGILASAVLQWLGGMAVVVYLWGRVKGR